MFSAVVTAGGLGTRIYPYSLAIPKEMLPLLVKRNGRFFVVPVLHYIFEALYDAGFRRFYFVVGRGKQAIEDYFTPTYPGSVKPGTGWFIEDFIGKVSSSSIVFIRQPEPLGFGDAVLRTEPFMVDDVFLVHAGDDIVYPGHTGAITALVRHYMEYEPDIVFLYDYSMEAERYGVIVGDDAGGYIVVRDIVEKPKKPPSNMVVVAVYIFKRSIYEALRRTRPMSGEHQLTDAIKHTISTGGVVHAVRVPGRRLDLGTPETYLDALRVLVDHGAG
ncbi:MAG: hypothetical protein GSR86_00870 [Desulfurococcales archaeon]|nr:hypothetical protein [Desulfurococcales archaeon]